MNTTGNEPLERPWRTNVKMYSDIYNEALRDSGKKFTVDLAEITSKLKKKIAAGEIGFTEASHIIIERTLLHVNDNSPVIVIALTPPYYPMVTNAMLGDGAKDVEKICSTVIKYAKERFGLEYMKYYIIGMSDLSYFLQCTNKENNDYIKNNMLLWGDIYSIPFHEMDGISMPVLNIGPWGKDVHKYTERVNVKDLCYNVPQLISLAIEEALR
jgi:arginine utilization protein RocB